MILYTTTVLLLLLALFTSVTTTAADTLTDDIIEWVRSKGGYFSDKLEIRHRNKKYPIHDDDDEKEDTSPILGVFAKHDIPNKERLLQIPHECYIQVREEDAKDMDVDDFQQSLRAYHENLCQLALKLKAEMNNASLLDAASSAQSNHHYYAPYIAYLKTQTPGRLPAMWSPVGKDLLRRVLPPHSDGVDWLDLYYKDHCDIITEEDDDDAHIMALTVQRAYDVALIPLWDMVNHDNGKINTENDSMYANGGIQVRASREIHAGEEIYATYDKCVDCMDIDDYWGTPEILRDFGFVEDYPRRWVFVDQEIWFEIWKDEDTGELEVIWDDDDDPGHEDAYGAPGKEGIEFLQKELVRLEDISLDSCPDSVPKNECDIILQYHSSAKTAMAAAIEAAKARARDNGDEL